MTYIKYIYDYMYVCCVYVYIHTKIYVMASIVPGTK